MRKRVLLLGVLGVLAGIGGFALYAQHCYPIVPDDGDESVNMVVDQGPHAATGFGVGSARIDSQITFAIPEGQADAVYEYLKEKYVGVKDLMKAQFPDRSIVGKDMSDSSEFTDSYFDTPDLALLRNKNSCRMRTRLNLTNPEERKSGRELVQMKVTPPGDFTMRSELKYKVNPSDKLKTVDDTHALIRLIDKDQREDFKRVYVEAGVNPYSLRHIFTIQQLRRRGYIDMDGKSVFSFSVDTGSASLFGVGGAFQSVDFGLVEVAYTEASPEERKLMWAVRAAAIEDFKKRFPAARQNSRSKYHIVLDQMMQKLSILPALIRLGMA